MTDIYDYRASKERLYGAHLESIKQKADFIKKSIRTSRGYVDINLYYPCKDQETYPVCFNFHGGGFVLGLMEQDDAYCRYLADEAGILVINVDYSLAPEYPFPESIHITSEVIDKVLEYSDDYQIDSSNVFLSGSSAGGNLALACQLYLWQTTKPSVAGVIVNYATFDLTQIFAQTRYKDWYLSKPEEAMNPLASPLKNREKLNTSVLLILAGQDPLYQEGLDYGAHLQQLGTEVEVMSFERAQHGFLHEMYQEYNERLASQAKAKITAFLKKKIDFYS
ncbi:alpha/beta hydrolase [Streptococcus merionis]|uniref:alpha/beta hydrolase n=1 Tax=Streptococcus merionis TaxID=400065 RepID=UPI0026EE32A1|nr:alpha/beta hydrolase [Streptococcus merionis]